MKNIKLWIAFFVALLIFILHMAGTYLFFYWRFEWYDLITHFLGGWWIAFAALSIGGAQKTNNAQRVWIGLLATLIVGILWEVFEVVAGATLVADAKYIPDTIIDLIMDMIGAYGGVIIYRTISKKKYEPKH